MDQTAQLEAQDAIFKINEINTIIRASNRVFLSGYHMILAGVLVLMTMVIGPLTQDLTFGHDFGANAALIITLINTAFYWGIAALISRSFLKRAKNRQSANLHPLITKAFSAKRPILFAVVGVILAFALVNQEQMIYPVVMILLGTLFSIYGRFTIPVVSYIAWTYIIAGLLMIYFTQFHIPNITLYLLGYQGLSLIIMGYFLILEEKNHVL